MILQVSSCWIPRLGLGFKNWVECPMMGFLIPFRPGMMVSQWSWYLWCIAPSIRDMKPSKLGMSHFGTNIPKQLMDKQPLPMPLQSAQTLMKNMPRRWSAWSEIWSSPDRLGESWTCDGHDLNCQAWTNVDLWFGYLWGNHLNSKWSLFGA